MSRIAIRVITKAGTDAVAGLRDEELVVRVKAAPEAGKANAAACKVVARFFGVAPSAVKVMVGPTSRHKVLEVQGVTDAEVDCLLASAKRLG